MDDSPIKKTVLKKNALSKKWAKLIKQQEDAPVDKHVNIQPECRLKVVNFFGDINTEIFCLDVSADEQYVSAGADNGDIRVYNIYEGKLLMLGNSSRLQGYPCTGIKWRPGSNKQFTSCNSDGAIRWLDRENQKVLHQHDAEIGYLCAGWNSSGDWSIYGNQKYQIQIFDGETKKLKQKYDAGSVEEWEPNHMNRIYCIKNIEKQPNLFYSGGWDSSVRVWDIRIPQTQVRKFYGPQISSDSLDLKGNNLLVGNYSNKNIVQIWDFRQGTLVKNVDLNEKEAGGSYCLTAAYSHKSKHNLYAAGLTSLNKVKIFLEDESVGDIQLQAAPLALQFYQFNNKDFLIMTGVQGTLYVVKTKVIQSQK